MEEAEVSSASVLVAMYATARSSDRNDDGPSDV